VNVTRASRHLSQKKRRKNRPIMIDDQIQLSLISLLVALSAAVSVSLRFQTSVSGRHLLRAGIGSIAVAVGVFITTFVVSGFGWGWPDPSRIRVLSLLALGGFGNGFSYVLFGWITSKRMSLFFAVSLLLANVGVALVPAEYNALGIAIFVLANFLLLSTWLSKPEPWQALHWWLPTNLPAKKGTARAD